MDILIKQGQILDPANNINRKGNLYLSRGKIIGRFKSPTGFKAQKIIDAKNKLVIPGIVDLAAYPELGDEHKATIKSETTAAASGGITSVCCPPDISPIIDTPAAVELIQRRNNQSNQVKLYTLGAMTQNLASQQMTEMHTLKEIGCIGISNGHAPVNHSALLKRCFEYAASCHLTVFLFAEDSYLNDGGLVHEGKMSLRMGLPAIPETAETVAISRALLLAEKVQVPIHFCKLSSARSVQMVQTAAKQGQPVTADVSICHLHLSEENLEGYNSLCHLRPPLRTLKDKEGLINAISSGRINAVCSDHQPHGFTTKEKTFTETKAGGSTIELLLPMMLTLVKQKKLNLNQAISAITCNPAQILGIEAGTLSIGAPADICIVNPDSTRTIDNKKLTSMGQYSPFHQHTATGQVSHTLLNGKLIYNKK